VKPGAERLSPLTPTPRGVEPFQGSLMEGGAYPGFHLGLSKFKPFGLTLNIELETLNLEH